MEAWKFHVDTSKAKKLTRRTEIKIVIIKNCIQEAIGMNASVQGKWFE